MKTSLMLLILLTSVLGCTREPKNTDLISPSVPTQANRELNLDEQVVICQVIGIRSERVSQILEQAGIDCTIQGDEFHEVSVPKHKRYQAVDIVVNDARQTGYEITLATIATELPSKNPSPVSIARQRFNEVFVKVIIPITARTPKQDGPVVESWVVEKLKQLGEAECFAVTNWVPICDELLADETIDNHVWDGSLGKTSFCPVGGDIPHRDNGHVLVSVGGWSPAAGYEARVTLADEPGSRTVEPVLYHSPSGERKQVQGERPMAFVAVLIAPPLRERNTPNETDN